MAPIASESESVECLFAGREDSILLPGEVNAVINIRPRGTLWNKSPSSHLVPPPRAEPIA